MLFFKLASSITYRKTPHNLCIKLGIKIRAQAGDAAHQKKVTPWKYHTQKYVSAIVFASLNRNAASVVVVFCGFFLSLFSYFNENGSLVVYCLYMFKSLVFVYACFNGSKSFLACACFNGYGSFFVSACLNGSGSFLYFCMFQWKWAFFVCACFNGSW